MTQPFLSAAPSARSHLGGASADEKGGYLEPCRVNLFELSDGQCLLVGQMRKQVVLEALMRAAVSNSAGDHGQNHARVLELPECRARPQWIVRT
jgi:hypothetical protein